MISYKPSKNRPNSKTWKLILHCIRCIMLQLNHWDIKLMPSHHLIPFQKNES